MIVAEEFAETVILGLDETIDAKNIAASQAGELILNGWSFTDETETVFLPGDLNKTAIVSAGASNTAITDDTTAPMPAAPVREWKKTGSSTQSISIRAGDLFTTTPQPGEVWEFTFHAKLVSGSQGDGFMVSFRADADDNAAVSDEARIMLDTDNQWHTYTAYVTVNADAYTHNDAITPCFGWSSNTGTGTMYVNGVTVRKVGNQWNNAAEKLGFTAVTGDTTVLEETDSASSPIAYEKTVKIANIDTQNVITVNAPVSSFPQPTATDVWTLSFWAKAENSLASLVKGRGTASAVEGFLTPETVEIAVGEWQYYVVSLDVAAGVSLADVPLYFTVSPQSTLYINGVSLVAGDVALAHESGQNSAALKNITRTLGNTSSAAKFNTAIEYDTDVNRTSYSRIKHYINDGEAISYEYDDAGNISKITNPDGTTVTYTYDALGQLLSEEYSDTVYLPSPMYGSGMDMMDIVRIDYTYDARGNMTRKNYTWSDGFEFYETMQYTDSVWNDRVTKIDAWSITYDEIGNPLNWTDYATLTWQRGRQLASFTRGSNAVTYTYNDDGIRTSKTVNGTTTNYTVVDGTLYAMSDGTNTLQFFDNSVLFNGTEYWYVYNAQNDIVGLIDTNGEYVVRYAYSAYGLPLSKTGTLADTLGTLNPYRYRGYIYDEETGWYYLQSRYNNIKKGGNVMGGNKDGFDNKHDSMKDVVEYQNNMYNPGHYIGTGRVPPTVSAPGNATPLAVLWFCFAVLFAVLGLIALFSDVRFASLGLIESDVVNKVIAVVILAAISVFCLFMALGYLRKAKRYHQQKTAFKKKHKKK